MECFGDVSGHFRGLIQHDCEVVVVGLVIGYRVAAARCPNRAVRNVADIREAKWNDLKEKQKRRMVECLQENDALEFGYAKFTAGMLHRLEKHYLLHQDVSFPPAWDLTLTGYAYGEIMFEYDVTEERRVIFYADRVASKPQTEDLLAHVTEYVNLDQHFIAESTDVKGVQAADCFAGAVAEDHKRGTDWLSNIDDDRITVATNNCLTKLEHDLDRYDKNISRR